MDARTLIDQQAEARASHVFLAWEPFAGPSRSWTYAEFRARVRSFANGLLERGLRAGDRLLIHGENSPDYVFAWLGAAYAGLVAVTTNVKSAPDELRYFIEHSAVRAMAVDAALHDGLSQVLSGVELVMTMQGSCPRALAMDEVVSEKAETDKRRANPEAPFSILYTSGTTARPKAVLWSHGNFLWGARESAAHEDLTKDDVHLVHMPLFHCNAQIYSVAAALWAGATVVLQPRFSASRFWDVSLRHGCTWSSMVPFMARALMQHPVPATHGYRFWGNGISDTEWDPHFGVRTIGWWGMTETVTHGSVSLTHLRTGRMSMGRPAAGYELHVLNEEMQPVGLGEVGDLYVRGQRGLSLFVEYAEDPEATAKAFTPSGLFITGDRVRIGPDGDLYFADRNKDMLKVGGENVAASEVERVLLGSGLLVEAAVVGQRDSMRGEVPVAFVITKPNTPDQLEQRLIALCNAQLASFKVPVSVHVVEDFPRGTLNKILKHELRNRLHS